MSPAYAAAVDEVFALVAYEAPEGAPMGRLMGAAQREAVADAVNAAFLRHHQLAAAHAGEPPLDPILGRAPCWLHMP